MNLKNKYIAELFGTFVLVFAGCCAIVVDSEYGGPMGHVGICLVFGLVVMAMIYAIGNVSGAHMNPAVTLTFWLSGQMKTQEVPGYIVSQLVGALAAATVLRLLFPENPTLGSTLPHAGIWPSFVMEFILSFFLMFVIFGISTGHMEKGVMAGVAVGGTVALDAFIGGPMTGASMNPARSLGPALLSGNMGDQWLYVLSPILGMFAAYPVSKMIHSAETKAPTPDA